MSKLKVEIKLITEDGHPGEWQWMGRLTKEHLKILLAIADSLNTLTEEGRAMTDIQKTREIPEVILKQYWGKDWLEFIDHYPEWDRLTDEQQEELNELVTIYIHGHDQALTALLEAMPEKRRIPMTSVMANHPKAEGEIIGGNKMIDTVTAIIERMRK